MSEVRQKELERARQIVNKWLVERGTTPRTLAKATGISGSSISRFLSGAGLDTTSAVRLYPVLRDRLSPEDRQSFLQATGLLSFAQALPNDPFRQTKTEAVPHTDGSPDWSAVRQMVGEMIAEHSSMRQLAIAAGLNQSVLSRFLNTGTNLDAGTCIKLYRTLPPENTSAQRSFLRATGLLPFIAASTRDEVFGESFENDPRYLIKRLLAEGDDLLGRYMYADALSAYHRAEDLGRSYPRLSAKAATKIALAYTDAGYYDRAHHILHQAMQLYETAIAPEDQVRMYRVEGWVNFAQGDYNQAERSFNQCIRLAEEAGYKPLAETAVHFLGQIYFARAKLLPPERRPPLFGIAKAYFKEAFQLHQGFSPDYGAYDLFRQSQLLQEMGNHAEAKNLRTTARAMFGSDLSYMVVDLEEARLKLEDREAKRARRAIQEVIEGWKAVRHFKEMAGPLSVLAAFELQNGSPQRALPLNIASLCIYPFADTAHNQNAWEAIEACCFLVSYQDGRHALRSEISAVLGEIEAREGDYEVLKDISTTHMLAVASIMERLEKISECHL